MVDPGVLRTAHYVPAAGAYRTAEGAIVVPWDKEWIKSATKADRDHILTDEQRDELRTHYATDAEPGRGQRSQRQRAGAAVTILAAAARRVCPGERCIAA